MNIDLDIFSKKGCEDVPVTISDVAKEAGVSISTVSKVLNHWTTISPATVTKVEEAIKKLNYTPNARAVSFARQSAQNIVFLTNLYKDEAYLNPHMFDTMCGVNYILSENGYNMTLVDTSHEKVPGETLARIVAQKATDGILIHGSAINEENAFLMTKDHFPHLVIGQPIPAASHTGGSASESMGSAFDSQLCWIDTNHALAGQFAAEHLLSRGYTDVAFIGGRKTDAISMQRQKGFTSAMIRSGHRMPAEHILYTSSELQDSYRAAYKLLTSSNRPRAIACENNTIAVSVMRALHDLQIRVPEEVALLTFDIYPYSQIIDPRPTVVQIDVYDMGIQAGENILRKIKNPALLIQSYTTLPVILPGETT